MRTSRAKTSRAKERCTDERGAAIVEFALVIPLFVFLLLGLIAFGLILALKQSVTQSAEEGARAAVGIFFVGGGPATVEDKERAAYEGARQGLTWMGERCCNHVGEGASATSDPTAPLSIATEVIGCDGGAPGPGNECMRVRVDYPYGDEPLIPLPDGIPPFSFVLPDVLRSEAVVRVNT